MSHLIDATIFILSKFITIILLESVVKGLLVEQGSQFILTCSQLINNMEYHSLSLNIISQGQSIDCLSNCKTTEYPLCNRLHQGTLNISCGSINCQYEPQCNFTFISPSIILDGVRVGCFDNNEKVEEWDIKGSDFPYVLSEYFCSKTPEINCIRTNKSSPLSRQNITFRLITKYQYITDILH